MRSQKRRKLNSSTGISTLVSENNHVQIEQKRRKTPAKRSMKQMKVAMDKALQNPLVLYKIIQSLEFIDLKASRLVNRMWKAVSSEVMLKKDCCVVKFNYDKKNHIYRQCCCLVTSVAIDFVEISPGKPLAELNKILEKSINFPSTSFTFLGCGDLDLPECRRFFEIQGQRIKTLELLNNLDEDDVETLTTKKTFVDILLRSAPNIENLKIAGIDFDWGPHEQLCLPLLKSFSRHNKTSNIARGILSGAKNLQQFKDFELDVDVELVSNVNKISTVKKLYCDNSTNADKLLTFLDHQTRLEKILFNIDGRFMNSEKQMMAFEKLFECNKHTIEYLDISELCSSSRIQIPKLLKLKTLKMGRYSARRCLPPGINLQEIFPNLRTLDCTHLSCHEDGNWEKHFPLNGVFGNFPLVENLEVGGRCTVLFMQRLHSLCPQFKLVVLHKRVNIHNMLPKVFRLWPHLEAIEIKVEAGFFNLDSVFTGLPESEIERLSSIKSDQPEKGFEKLRHGPSICTLKGLKKLKIMVDCRAYYCDHRKVTKPTKKTMPLTRISAIYAFKVLQDLKVSIEYDHTCPGAADIKASFQSIAPYVNFSHKRCVLHE